MRSLFKKGAPILAALTAWLVSTAVLAQQPIPPTHYTTDARGVDLTNGGYFPFVTEVVIGQPGAGGLVYGRSHIGTGWRDSLLGTVNIEGTAPATQYIVSIGGYSDAFTPDSSTPPNFTPVTPNGSSLTYSASSNDYTYTTSTGVVAVFDGDLSGRITPYEQNAGLVTSITSPNGEVLTYTYRTANLCDAAGCTTTTAAARLMSVTNNLGYQIKYEYHANGTAFADREAWMSVSRVIGLNRGVDWCADDADSCTFTVTWPSISYPTDTDPLASTTVDEMNRTTIYRNDTDGRLTGVRLPGSSADNLTITYDTNGYVDTLTDASGAWNYDFLGQPVQYVTVNGPQGQSYEVRTNSSGNIQFYQDADGEQTLFTWLSPSQVSSVTYPEGNSVEYLYDGRGNIVETRFNAKPGSGLADIVTTVTYPASCSSPGVTQVTCNLPTSTTDARGNVTNFTWDSTHGGLLTVTLPAPSTGWDRPQTRIAYGQVYAWYKDSTGAVVQAPTPVTLPVSVSACQFLAAPACVGTAYERLTETTYGTAGPVFNNLLPSAVTVGTGDGATEITTTFAYTNRGDVSNVYGPLAGSADRTQYRYNNNRELTGIVGPDPDGTGTLAHRAVRITRNALGLPTTVQYGTVPGYSSTDWNNFIEINRTHSVYDFQGRLIREHLREDAGTIYWVRQYAYDASGRLECAVQRMNPATFSNPPADACTSATAGTFGPDRIARWAYNDLSQVISVTSGYGTASAIVESLTYTDNGRVETVTDGEGNLTTFAYDGFDRAWRTYFPNASGSGSSTTDYEELSYSAAGMLSASRSRDGSLFSYSFDNLGRLFFVDAPGATPDQTTAHDFFGMPYVMITSGSSGQTIDFTYDALSRLLEEDGPLGAVAYQYDLAGRMTRITWPDAYYAAYDYDLTNALTAVRENGATSGAGVLATYTWDNLGRMIGIGRGNGVSTTFTWNTGSRLTGISHNLAGTAQDQAYTFTYNPAGQIVSRAATNDLYAFTANPAIDDDYVNNGLNQVTAVDLTAVTWDSRGNLTSDGATSFSYDAFNRLTEAGANTFSFDAASRLYETVAGSATRRFLYGRAQALAEYDGAGALISRYIPGVGIDSYAAYSSGSGGSIVRTWPIADQVGSVIGLTNASGAAAQINAYDEYGVPAQGNTGRFGYTGQMYIPEAGSAPWQYRARQYHSGLGRFVRVDPMGLGTGLNLYEYVQSDPVNLVDPLGLFGLRDGEWVTVHQCWEGGGSVEVVNGKLMCVLRSFAIPSLSWLGSIGDWVASLLGGGGAGAASTSPSQVCPVARIEGVVGGVAEGRLGARGLASIDGGIDVASIRYRLGIEGGSFVSDFYFTQGAEASFELGVPEAEGWGAQARFSRQREAQLRHGLAERVRSQPLASQADSFVGLQAGGAVFVGGNLRAGADLRGCRQ